MLLGSVSAFVNRDSLSVVQGQLGLTEPILGGLQSQNCFHTHSKIFAVFALISHEGTVEFSRSYMMCDDVVSLCAVHSVSNVSQFSFLIW